jgi:phosphoribosylanthranilate isomerase
MSLKIKICGLRESGNIMETAKLEPDFMGFIFYKQSARYAGEILDPEITAKLPLKIKKTGVFVNEDMPEINRIIRKYTLDAVQLHGDETPELCKHLTQEGIVVIKAFRTNESTDFKSYSDFIPYTEYFLFDNFTQGYGGSGKKFEWKILDSYDLGHPFFLSGGITASDVSKILDIKNPSFCGIDLNSRFEVKPGQKDGKILKAFISEIHSKINPL